jgi:hypothetical protein
MLRKGQVHAVKILSARKGRVLAEILTHDFQKCRIEIDDSESGEEFRSGRARIRASFIAIASQPPRAIRAKSAGNAGIHG